jgi:hypothetical protein
MSLSIPKYSPSKLNELEVNRFNSMRKANIKYESNQLKESHENSSKLIGSYAASAASKSSLREGEDFLVNGEYYLAADGTQYRKVVTDGVAQTTIDFPKNALHIPGKYHELYRHSVLSHEIPQNLRHKFGSQDTEQLLEDQIKVHDTLAHIQNTGIIKKVDRTANNRTPFEMSNDVILNNGIKNSKCDDYYDLGNYLRHAVGHGYPMVNARGTTSFDFNLKINQDYLADKSNYESANRRKKDWLGKGDKNFYFIFYLMMIKLL